MKKTLFASALVIGAFTAQSASAVTAVINFSGVLDEATLPGYEGLVERATSDESVITDSGPGLGNYDGTIHIGGMEDWFSWERIDGQWVPQLATTTIDFDTDESAGMRLNGGPLRSLEAGSSGWIANPDFDSSLPHCSERNFDRGRCAPVNSAYSDRVGGLNFGELLGTATAEVVDGVLSSFSYVIDRSSPEFTEYDEMFQNAGVNLQVDSVTLMLSDFTFNADESGNGLAFFEAGTSYATFTTSPAPVPLPAAAWLFGSALLGMVGVGRRRKQAKA